MAVIEKTMCVDGLRFLVVGDANDVLPSSVGQRGLPLFYVPVVMRV